MKRSDLIRSIQVKFQRMRQQDAADMLDNLVETLTKGIAAGNRVEIRGFGVWTPRMRAAKNAFNPRTRKPLPLKAGRTLLFRPSREMIKEINNK